MLILAVTLAEQKENMWKRIVTSLASSSAILPMTSTQEGLFSKSTSLFGLRRAPVKSRKTNRSLFPAAFSFT